MMIVIPSAPTATITAVYALQPLGLAILLLGPAAIAPYVVVVLFGAGRGADTLIRNTAVARIYGPRRFASIQGVLSLIVTGAWAGSPVALGAVYDGFGSYDVGLWVVLVASAVECVLAQRLARKLCGRCKIAYSPAPELLTEYGIDDPDTVFYRAMGCHQCSNTGYRGRVALVELMLVSDEIEKLTVERKSAEDVRRVALVVRNAPAASCTPAPTTGAYGSRCPDAPWPSPSAYSCG